MEKLFEKLTEDVRDFHAPREVERIRFEELGADPPAEFRRRFVSKNIPCVIAGAEPSRWSALADWQADDHLARVAGGSAITVDVTPNGLGDAVLDTPSGPVFVKPCEVSCSLKDYLDCRRARRASPSHPASARPGGDCASGGEAAAASDNKLPFCGTHYCSHQNSSLSEQLASLYAEVDPQLAWATGAFGSPPDAVNFWMGDADAVTSMHKDFYENMYVVVTGCKHFVLLPPTELFWLRERSYPAATFKYRPGGEGGGGARRPWGLCAGEVLTSLDSFDVVLDGAADEDSGDGHDSDSSVPWISVDPEAAEEDAGHEGHEHFSRYPPLRVSVGPGEVLYLPAMWLHKVKQDDRTIAVNYWHDMDFAGPAFPLFKFMEAVAAGHA